MWGGPGCVSRCKGCVGVGVCVWRCVSLKGELATKDFDSTVWHSHTLTLSFQPSRSGKQ